MKIAILGYDVEGRSSYDYFNSIGNQLTICDQNEECNTPEGSDAVLGADYLVNLDRFDVLVRTAGLHPQKILDKNPNVAGKITTHINEFLKACPSKNVIGVTGTKGKGTTTTLIAKILQETGKDVQIGGNIGVTPLTFLNDLKPESWVVLELSSFQLIDVKHSPQYAVCLMVVPEHLNWHKDLDEYIHAKSQLFIHQTTSDTCIYFADNELTRQIISPSLANKIPYYAPPGALVKASKIIIGETEICDVSDINLLGEHNWQNVCAAITTIWQIDKNVEAIRSVLKSFSGLEHRLEFVKEINSVSYYNDSFGTTPETAMAAIRSFNIPEIVILGGQGKGIGFDELAQAVKDKSNIAKTLVIGEAQQEIIESLKSVGFSDYIESQAKDMSEIVKEATNLTKNIREPSVVLLSTGCASFDMFKNYKQRGELFKQAVQSISQVDG